MKYYYQNQLIRTSENDYKFALVVESEGKIFVKKCSSTRKGCETELNRLTKLFRNCQSKGINFEEAKNYWLSYATKYKNPNFKFDRKLEAVIKGVWSDQLNQPSKYQIVEIEAR